ncbi:putative short chain dehydrogenase/reductase [Xylaria intraflava]|nr:putative short chain dehydrogenase/reductase [Xylaria intraflava]
MASKIVALITGANGGIGFETVKALAATSSNYHVLLGSRSVEKGQQALREIHDALGDSVKAAISVIQIDVCDKKSIETTKEAIEAQFGKLDVLINNAGIMTYQETDTMISLRSTFETNVFGQLVITETLEGLLQKSAKPYVIYVSSMQGSITQRLNPQYRYYQVRGDHYRMSKAALNMLAACHRHNFAEWGCKVLSFNPGYCVSNLTGEEGRKVREKDKALHPSVPANVLVDILMGKRDEDIEKNGMVDVDGGIAPW